MAFTDKNSGDISNIILDWDWSIFLWLRLMALRNFVCDGLKRIDESQLKTYAILNCDSRVAIM